MMEYFSFCRTIIFTSGRSVLKNCPRRLQAIVLLGVVVPALMTSVLLNRRSIPLTAQRLIIMVITSRKVTLRRTFTFVDPSIHLQVILLMRDVILDLNGMRLIRVTRRLSERRSSLAMKVIVNYERAIMLTRNVNFCLRVLIRRFLPFTILRAMNILIRRL